VISLTRALAAETAAFGITANAIAPAYVKTPMVTEQLSEAERQVTHAAQTQIVQKKEAAFGRLLLLARAGSPPSILVHHASEQLHV